MHLNNNVAENFTFNAFKERAGKGFMHDQGLLDALFGGADPGDPETWAPKAKNMLAHGLHDSVEGCQNTMKRMPPYMSSEVELLPHFVFNINPWTFYRGTFKLHAIALNCPEKSGIQGKPKLEYLLNATKGIFYNPCNRRYYG